MTTTTHNDSDEYGLHARDYLARACACLAEGSRAALFYAAFELRCGIEARLQQYLEAQREKTRKIKQGWRIAKLARHVERRFKTGDKVVTSGLSDDFPKGLLIGDVAGINSSSTELFQKAAVSPAADLRSLRFLFVVL